ncbi:MAG: Tex family protein, partial [Pseudomonadota bacterium]
YTDYLKYAEPIRKIPSHRALALFRGRRENALQLSLSLPDAPDYGEKRLLAYFNIADSQRPADPWLLETVRLTWKGKIATKLELELLTRLRELADEEAIRVFASNLHDLLLASPAGSKITIGLDPGIRTGIKVAVVDNTGKLLDYTTVFPLAPHNQLQQSIADIAKLAAKYRVELISIGNGTGSRETERLCADLIKMYPDLKLTKVLVSEAGASVYSASELAANEFPDLDVTLRGAVSIARRLQDPLAELVKIDPKSIGVGQYQHDVNQARLARCLEGVVEDCVNAVGVDVNRASAPLLMRVSGLNEILAKNLIQYRDEHGPFKNRQQLKLVPRMGEKTFMLAAGFLRITDGDNPLDASGVHPEAYPLVEKMLADKQLELQQTIGQHSILQSVNAEHYVDEHFGLPTIRDVLLELEKPGRDPRPEFKTATFKEGIEDINHLHEGMILEGVVSNVTNFGAFVDIGVHQDGLIHISAMTNRFINDPRSVVKAGDIVTVRVVEVDKNRRRIGLSMKLEEEKIEPTKVSKPSHEPKTITPKVHASKKHSKPEHKK